MAKKRVENHLSEINSKTILCSYLPREWVVRDLHPDYGIDIAIEVFETVENTIPTMGEFIFVQIKSSKSLKHSTTVLKARTNVEKKIDTNDGVEVFELDVISFQIDTDTFDNARLMGPSTPLILMVVDLASEEVYYVCLTDYYDKILEPRGINLSSQDTVTIYIPKSNVLSSPRSIRALRLFGARAKLYGMFNLVQFQFREMRYILDNLNRIKDVAVIYDNLKIIDRFARRLNSMPIWNRVLSWDLLRIQKNRLDLIVNSFDNKLIFKIIDDLKKFLNGDKNEILILIDFHRECGSAWEQFSAIGQTFEDVVREWFLPTALGVLASCDKTTYREIGE